MPDKIPTQPPQFVLGLPAEKAKAWFAKKQISTKDFAQITAAEHAKVFTMAGVTNLHLLNDVKQSLDKAIATGQPFGAWKSQLLNTLKNKGWVQEVGYKTEIFDPDTGEYFGTSHRLKRIYQTNMQSAYSAQKYQNYIRNVDNRPYWRYDAVGDDRTRPAHLSLDGIVARYDDPFWASHYPPNGYNCRCSVTTLSEKDIKRRNISVHETAEADVVSVDKIINKNGDKRKVNGIKIGDTVYAPDVGFDYNIGRMNYRPNLDDYDKSLAQAFTQREMAGRDFAFNYKRIEQSVKQIKSSLNIADNNTLSGKQMLDLRNQLTVFNTYGAGILSDDVAKKIGTGTATVWLSDDTLIKQINSRLNEQFGLADYAELPQLINQPDYVLKEKNNSFVLIKNKLAAVIKAIANKPELFLVSFRKTNNKELAKMLDKLEKI